MMKVGGNASFTDFLARHPGSHSYGNSDAKDKYTSRAATLYKDELAKRMAVDEAKFGKDKVVVGNGGAAAAPAPVAADGDFFDTWDAPVKKVVATPSGASTPLISFGLTPGSTPLNSRPTSPMIPTAAPKAPVARTVTSSSLRTAATGSTTSTARAKVSLGARTVSSTATASAGAGARGKMGVKKGGTVNFEEAERRAKEDEERVKRLGYDSKLEQEAAAAAAKTRTVASGSSSAAGAKGGKMEKKESLDTDRLGMGIKRLGFGQTTGVSGEQSAKDAAAAAKAATRRANGYEEEAGSSHPIHPSTKSQY
jgi:ADP-ribosylation factor GTPase-activating protein 2/3